MFARSIPQGRPGIQGAIRDTNELGTMKKTYKSEL